ncbi:MAG: HisA/HisF-related TIM barrel protein [Actinomycetota bacterium]|nr:HisA/HisF-related TIM barrel protein [Actinomycetota bacterium]MDK1027298.1 HisA/HisF-related TIM barrel protein [Actinomycetota bacterium]MDK1039050.1 HisA/HisF-related TIM barrel protein [Actinomycetota bacterium]MDK1291171.1 HisA/HisF-related TIM barrel protein [Actinomycetota bacterium]
MELYARVNILDGRAVRLPYGDVNDWIALDDDPVNRARGWVAKGAHRLHIVDLDAAAYGDYKNRDLIAEMIRAVDVPVQVGGGIRSQAEVERVLGMGASRVVMGTLPIIDQVLFWELNRQHPHRIIVSLDVRPDFEISIKGWTEQTGEYLEETLINLSSGGAAGFMISEVGRDALVEPPNFEAFELAVSLVDEPVIAAGGVRDLDDIAALVALSVDGRRLAGLVVGREVTSGRFTIEEAAEVLAVTEDIRGPWTRSELDAALVEYSRTVGDPADTEAAATFVAWLASGGA